MHYNLTNRDIRRNLILSLRKHTAFIQAHKVVYIESYNLATWLKHTVYLYNYIAWTATEHADETHVQSEIIYKGAKRPGLETARSIRVLNVHYLQ